MTLDNGPKLNQPCLVWRPNLGSTSVRRLVDSLQVFSSRSLSLRPFSAFGGWSLDNTMTECPRHRSPRSSHSNFHLLSHTCANYLLQKGTRERRSREYILGLVSLLRLIIIVPRKRNINFISKLEQISLYVCRPGLKGPILQYC